MRAAVSSEPSGFTGLIVRRALKSQDPQSQEGRSRLGEWEGVIGAVVSLLLALAKLLLFSYSGSVALLADGINNLTDIAGSGLLAFGFRIARKPRDREHPYGHGRVESIATLVLATLLVGVALQMAQTGVRRLLDPVVFEAPLWILLAVTITILVKFWLAVFARRLAALTGSSALKADAWNHTFDIASTALVLVALVGAWFGWASIDGWAALGISLFIGYTGFRYIRGATDSLIGEAPSHTEIHRVHRLATRVPGIFGAHDILIHRYGDRLLISLHVEVDARQSALQSHALAEAVEDTVAGELQAKVIVHPDPVDHSHPMYSRAAGLISEVLDENEVVVGYHDLRLEGEGDGLDISVDLVVCAEIPNEEFPNLLDSLAVRIREGFPGLGRLDLGIESEYASDHEVRSTYPRGEPDA